MIYFVAILVAFIGGLLGRAVGFRTRSHRLLAFIVPVLTCAALLQLAAAVEMVVYGQFPRRFEDWMAWSTSQSFALMAAFVVAGMGWLVAYIIQAFLKSDVPRPAAFR